MRGVVAEVGFPMDDGTIYDMVRRRVNPRPRQRAIFRLEGRRFYYEGPRY